ncbi:tripartite tricarboxylate transporter TctB family protein [Bosea beijingensis]|uniref:tripartite tricarboxylate transporter TctB family protein n=1 Tax=Bosea beijingensis TaxID=3068632 RepID=UPI0027415D61|nr:tripartite tricarboxylate transporter TctB family protein [Bosea sp. REN20]
MQEKNEAGPARAGEPGVASASTGGDLAAGLLFAVFGLLALFIGRDYPAGSSLDMGPGYIPRAVAAGLLVIGLLLAVRGAGWRPRRWPAFPLRAAFSVSLAILLFGLLIERAGLFVACLACVLAAALGDPQARWREVPVVALVFAGFAAVLFGYVLRLSVQVWPL